MKDSGALFTGADAVSVARYGHRTWTFPDNRFMPYEWVDHWVAKFIQEYGHPKYKLTMRTPFKDRLVFRNPAGTLLTKIRVTDSVMFPNVSDFSVNGFLAEMDINIKNFVVTLSIRTEEKY